MTAVRPYLPSDRDAVRHICYQTGFMGEPVDWYWRDVESYADMWSAYYTDQEPESLFVAVDDTDGVIGYVAGCVDTSVTPTPMKALAPHLFKRLVLYRPGTAGFFRRGMIDNLRDRNGQAGELRDPRWPSHLHINLLPEARGRGAGAALMQAELAHLRRAGSPGCHLSTLHENSAAIAFFRAFGFEFHGQPELVPGMRTRDGARMHTQIMTQSF